VSHRYLNDETVAVDCALRSLRKRVTQALVDPAWL
jgi:hypothetical protein